MTWKELKEQIEGMDATEQEQNVRFVDPTHARQVMWLTTKTTLVDIREGEDEDRGTAIPAGQLFLCEETISMAELDALFETATAG